jgi:hypothetical protein
VVQQRSGPVDGSPVAGGVSVSSPDDRFERAASESADRAIEEDANADGTVVQRAVESDDEIEDESAS